MIIMSKVIKWQYSDFFEPRREKLAQRDYFFKKSYEEISVR